MSDDDETVTVRTLTGEEAEVSARRERPDTLPYCHECEEYILRRDWYDHEEHSEAARDEWPDENDGSRPDEEDDEEDDEPIMKVGGKYEVRLSYSVDYSFYVYAGNEHQAKREAKDLVEYGNAVDAMHVHDDISEIEEIYEDDPEAEEYDLRP